MQITNEQLVRHHAKRNVKIHRTYLTYGHVHHKVAVFPILGLLYNFVCYTLYISLLPLILFSEKFQIFTPSSTEDAMLLYFFIIKIFQSELGPDFRYKKTHFAMLYKELFNNKVVWRNSIVL